MEGRGDRPIWRKAERDEGGKSPKLIEEKRRDLGEGR